MKIAVVGAGKLGASITEVMSGGGHDLTLIDSSESAIRRAQNTTDVMTVKADGRRSASLRELKIGSYDLLIAATGLDETNIFIASMARKLGCPMVVARVRGPEHVDQLPFIRESFDIDYAVSPDLTCAEEIFRYLTRYGGGSRESFAIDDAEILEFDMDMMPELAGKQVKDVASLLEGMLIAAVSRNGKIIIPNGSTALLENDSLYVLCRKEQTAALKARLSGRGKKEKLRRVMIAGGGRTAFYLAKLLTEAGVSVKIIETDRERCAYLAENLENVLVLHGNAQDPDLLRDESLDSMDAFVAATGMDETNILLSIMAQQHHVPHVVAKISRNDYTSLNGVFSDTMLVNPVDMCTAAILKYAEKKEVILFSRMIQGQAEFVEIRAEEGMPLTEKPLRELEIPSGVLIVTVNRSGEVLIPTGSTRILPGDRVIILSLLSSTGSLEALLSRGSAHSM